MGLLDACIGDEFERQLVVSDSLMDDFSKISGDFNPLHTNEKFAKKKGFSGRIAYGTILNLMVSSILGMDLNDDNVMLLSQRIEYKKPIFIGDTITATGTISAISVAVKVVEFKFQFKNQNKALVAKGNSSLQCI